MPYTSILLNKQLHWQGDAETKTLFIEKVNSVALARLYGTPTFVYSKQYIKQQIQRYQQGLKGRKHRINYAVKSNSNLTILRLIADQGCDFDVVSGGEIARVLQAGGQFNQITFSGVGKSVAEITQAIRGKVQSINIESFAELQRISNIAEQLQMVANVSLRVNPDVNPKTHPYISTGLKNNKFGVAATEVMSLYQFIKQQPWLKPVGISCHIGSQLFDVSPLMQAANSLVTITKQLAEQGIDLQFIDVGGGIGIAYNAEELQRTIDWQRYFQFLQQNIPPHYEIHVEPGRSITGNAGILISQIEYLKANTQRNFVIVDAAMNDLLRPALYQAHHEVIPCQFNATINASDWQVVGPVCESADFVTPHCQLPLEPLLPATEQATSLLAIQSAGAYSFSMASNYNSRNRAAEVLVDGNKHQLIRRRETYKEQFAQEINDL